MKTKNGQIMDKIFIPHDNEYYRDFYESQGKGSCGLSILAVIFRKSIKEILDGWKDYKGHAPVQELRRFLEINCLKIKKKNIIESYDILKSNNARAIFRIQWLGNKEGKFHGWDSWFEATSNTHYLYLENNYLFCNVDLWFPKENLYHYLGNNGIITSSLEIEE